MLQKFTNRDLANTIIGLNNFKRGSSKKPVKLMYAINRNLDHLRTAVKPFETSRQEIMSKYFETDKAGKLVPIDGKKEIAESEMSELLEIEIDVEVHKIPLDMIDGIEVSGEEFDAIDFMIEGGEQ